MCRIEDFIEIFVHISPPRPFWWSQVQQIKKKHMFQKWLRLPMYRPCFKGSSVKTCLAVVIILPTQTLHFMGNPSNSPYICIVWYHPKNGNLMIPVRCGETTSPGWPSGALPVASFRRSFGLLFCSFLILGGTGSCKFSADVGWPNVGLLQQEIPCGNLVFLRELFKS